MLTGDEEISFGFYEIIENYPGVGSSDKRFEPKRSPRN